MLKHALRDWRVAVNADGVETRNLHDKHLLLWETDDANIPTAKHTYEPADYGNLVSRRDESTSETVYYHYDALGSTAALTDDTYTYEAWGDTQHSGASDQPFQWVGELGYQYDENTDRHHLRRRDYDSQISQSSRAGSSLPSSMWSRSSFRFGGFSYRRRASD